MSRIRDLSVLLPFILTGGVLASYGLAMVLFLANRFYGLASFSPFLLVGTLLLCLGPAAVVVLRRASTVRDVEERVRDRSPRMSA